MSEEHPYLPSPDKVNYSNHPPKKLTDRETILDNKRNALKNEAQSLTKRANDIQTQLDTLDRESVCFERGFHDPQLEYSEGDFYTLNTVNIMCKDCGATLFYGDMDATWCQNVAGGLTMKEAYKEEEVK